MNDTELRQTLQTRLATVEQRIQAACDRAERPRSAITLIAVTKTVTPRGIVDLGESRPQELRHKAEALSDLPIVWHMIGHLQRNKVDRTLPLAALIHSGDSLRLLETIAAEGAKQKITPRVLLQINISDEEQKHGFDEAELLELKPTIERLPLKIEGLMGMAALNDDPEQARPAFKKLRELRDRLRNEWTIPAESLSMGMSGDFEVAIEEGATHVRIGTTLFEGLEGE
jgi:pyridoxal phosphate enzyme (YggS family)